MDGWLKLHRSLSDHWIFSFKEPDKALAWIDLLIMARHTSGTVMMKGRALHLERGQIGVSQLSLQKKWGWSQNKVKRFLNLLKKHDMCDFKTNDLTTVITICNFDSFQGGERADERPNGRADERPVERTTNDQSNDDIRKKESKEGNNVINTSVAIAPVKQVKRFTPPDQQEVCDYMYERIDNAGAARTESESFCDFYASKGWMVGKNKMKDWKAAVRNWLKNYKPTTGYDPNNTDWINDMGEVL